MSEYIYTAVGTCCKHIKVVLDGKTIVNVEFDGGCNGNLKAISKLVEGMSVEDIEKQLAGNTCGFKTTSCADQLAKAVRQAYTKQK